MQLKQQRNNFKIQISFDRSNSTYKPEQMVTGTIQLFNEQSDTFKIDVGSLVIKPVGKLFIGSKPNKRIQAIANQIETIYFLKSEPIELAKNKTLNQSTLISFRFKLSKQQHKYAQTYVGIYLSITYEIQVSVKFNDGRSLKQQIPFFVQVPKQGRETIQEFIHPKKKNFMIKSEDMKGNKLPKFKIRVQLQSQIIFFSEDLNALLIIDQAEEPIRQISMQMFRVQKITTSTQTISQRTQIQLIQMCDGDVTRNLELPLYMNLPRYYSCPSLKYLWCQLDFQVDLIIVFKDGYKVTANIPVKFIRS